LQYKENTTGEINISSLYWVPNNLTCACNNEI
jgi:hypothetical protein